MNISIPPYLTEAGPGLNQLVLHMLVLHYMWEHLVRAFPGLPHTLSLKGYVDVPSLDTGGVQDITGRAAGYNITEGASMYLQKIKPGGDGVEHTAE